MGMAAKASRSATVDDYRSPPTLSGNMDDLLLAHFFDIFEYVCPQTAGSENENRGERLKRALRSYAVWKDAVHLLADHGAKWPSAEALQKKHGEVQLAAEALFDNMIACTSKAIPYMHDMLHNELYLLKDQHTLNAEAQEHVGKVVKLKGREASNGKEGETCKSICVSIAADKVIEEARQQPLSANAAKVQRQGHIAPKVVLDVKCQLFYGKSPDFTSTQSEL